MCCASLRILALQPGIAKAAAVNRLRVVNGVSEMAGAGELEAVLSALLALVPPSTIAVTVGGQAAEAEPAQLLE